MMVNIITNWATDLNDRFQKKKNTPLTSKTREGKIRKFSELYELQFSRNEIIYIYIYIYIYI